MCLLTCLLCLFVVCWCVCVCVCACASKGVSSIEQLRLLLGHEFSAVERHFIKRLKDGWAIGYLVSFCMHFPRPSFLMSHFQTNSLRLKTTQCQRIPIEMIRRKLCNARGPFTSQQKQLKMVESMCAAASHIKNKNRKQKNA